MQWWTKTAWAVKNQAKPDSRHHTINWGSLTRKNDKWDHYKDCALVSSGEFNIICRHSDEIMVHPSKSGTFATRMQQLLVTMIITMMNEINIVFILEATQKKRQGDVGWSKVHSRKLF